MQMNKSKVALRFCLLLTLLVMVVTSCRSGDANESLQPGDQYEIIRPIYLTAWYNSLNNKQISKEAARAYLDAKHMADRVWHAFRSEVPAGTIMTIIGPAPKVRYFLFFTSKAKRYFVRLEPDPSRGLDVELELDRGIEGSLDGLNPKLFRRLQNNENHIR
jgi:hypothetical protein